MSASETLKPKPTIGDSRLQSLNCQRLGDVVRHLRGKGNLERLPACRNFAGRV